MPSEPSTAPPSLERSPREDAASCLAAALGRSRHGSLERARCLIRRHGLASLSRMGRERLEGEAGLDGRTAARLEMAFALGRSVERARLPLAPRLQTPADVDAVLGPELRGLERETFQVLVLDAKHRLKALERISEGTLTSSLVHPREVFRPALRHAGAALIVAHNHPSGDPEPSAEDLAITRRLVECGKLLGIGLLDHVVFGESRCVSIRERLEW